MSLVTTTELANYLKLDASTAGLTQAISAAEALVSSIIGIESLTEKSGVEESRNTLSCRKTMGVKIGPISNISDIKVNSVSLDAADYIADIWFVDLNEPMSKDDSFYISYTAGYTAETLPDALKQSIILTGAMLFNKPDVGIKAESIGDYRAQYTSELPEPVLSMISFYKRPMF